VAAKLVGLIGRTGVGDGPILGVVGDGPAIAHVRGSDHSRVAVGGIGDVHRKVAVLGDGVANSFGLFDQTGNCGFLTHTDKGLYIG